MIVKSTQETFLIGINHPLLLFLLRKLHKKAHKIYWHQRKDKVTYKKK